MFGYKVVRSLPKVCLETAHESHSHGCWSAISMQPRTFFLFGSLAQVRYRSYIVPVIICNALFIGQHMYIYMYTFLKKDFVVQGLERGGRRGGVHTWHVVDRTSHFILRHVCLFSPFIPLPFFRAMAHGYNYGNRLAPTSEKRLERPRWAYINEMRGKTCVGIRNWASERKEKIKSYESFGIKRLLPPIKCARCYFELIVGSVIV